MKKIVLPFLILSFSLLLSGCDAFFQAAATPTMAPTFTPIIMPTEIPLPTAAQVIEPTPTATPEPTTTPEPVSMINAEVIFDNYALRSGPGRLFDRIALYATGEPISILGRESSDNWVLVITSDYLSGWMNVVGLDFVGSIRSLPVFEVPNTVMLHGHVYLQTQIPAQGIGVSLAPSTTNLAQSTDISTTNENGEWAIYLPAGTAGEWVVGPNSYNCEGSNAVNPGTDGDCTLLGKFPDGQVVNLPLDRDVSIKFEILPLNP